jgi:hypothetical protein
MFCSEQATHGRATSRLLPWIARLELPWCVVAASVGSRLPFWLPVPVDKPIVKTPLTPTPDLTTTLRPQQPRHFMQLLAPAAEAGWSNMRNKQQIYLLPTFRVRNPLYPRPRCFAVTSQKLRSVSHLTAPRSLPKASAEVPCLSVTADRLDGYACPGFRPMLPSASMKTDVNLPIYRRPLYSLNRIPPQIPCLQSSETLSPPLSYPFSTPTRGRLCKQMDHLALMCSCEYFGKLPIPAMSLCGAL